MRIDTHVRLNAKGTIQLTKYDKFGRVRSSECPANAFYNTVTSAALPALLESSNTIFKGLVARVGTGSTEITPDHDNLTSPVNEFSTYSNASRGGNEVDNGDGTSTITSKRVLEFDLGALAGTFSEVGLFNTARSGRVLVAGQLIKDEFGEPTTITILEDEQLVVTYTLEWTLPNQSSVAGTGTLTTSAGTEHSYQMWAMPFFKITDIPSTDAFARIPTSTTDYGVAIRGADGTTNYGWAGDGPTMTIEFAASGDGTLTLSFDSGEYPPTSGAFTDAKYATFGRTKTDASKDTYDIINIGDSIDIKGSTNFDGDLVQEAFAIIEFIDPITKTSDDAFRISGSITYTV